MKFFILFCFFLPILVINLCNRHITCSPEPKNFALESQWGKQKKKKKKQPTIDEKSSFCFNNTFSFSTCFFFLRVWLSSHVPVALYMSVLVCDDCVYLGYVLLCICFFFYFFQFCIFISCWAFNWVWIAFNWR